MGQSDDPRYINSARLEASAEGTLEEVRGWLAQLLPEAALRSEVMKCSAESFFVGKPHIEKYMLQLYGDGNNGKTTLMELLRVAFPAWVKMIEVEHLLMKGKFSDADAPQSWKLDVMGCHILCMEEAPAGRSFDGKAICKMTGGGVVTGRLPYGQNVSYLPTYRPFIAGNAPIEIEPVDRAVLNRIVVYELPSTFVDAGDIRLGQPLVFEKVPNLQHRFRERKYKIALFQILVDYYQEYQQHGLNSQKSKYDLRSIYEGEHGKTDQQWFDEFFEITGRIDGKKSPTRGVHKKRRKDIHERLQRGGYKLSAKKFNVWLQPFLDKANVRKVNKSGTDWYHGVAEHYPE